MISYELANHEACIACDYTDTLRDLGLTFDSLEGWEKQIVKEELRKQINDYYQEGKLVLFKYEKEK